MSTFRDLKVYQLCRILNKDIFNVMKSPAFDRNVKDQLGRATLSIALNIAEGSGRFSHKDKRNFYVIARGSVFECVSMLGLIHDEGLLTDEHFQAYYKQFERVSRMLFGMINKLAPTEPPPH